MRLRWSLMCLLLAATSVFAAGTPEYATTVKQTYVPKASHQRVALLPLFCPAGVPCTQLEDAFADELASTAGFQVVGAEHVRRVMARSQLSRIADQQTRQILADKLDLDAFVLVDVQQARVETAAPSGADKWAEVKRDISVTRAKLEMQLVAVDGTVLARVSGEAQVPNTVRSLAAVTVETFQTMLERSMPPAREQPRFRGQVTIDWDVNPAVPCVGPNCRTTG